MKGQVFIRFDILFGGFECLCYNKLYLHIKVKEIERRSND